MKMKLDKTLKHMQNFPHTHAYHATLLKVLKRDSIRTYDVIQLHTPGV